MKIWPFLLIYYHGKNPKTKKLHYGMTKPGISDKIFIFSIDADDITDATNGDQNEYSGDQIEYSFNIMIFR